MAAKQPSRELLAVVIIGCLCLLASNLPYLAGWVVSSSNLQFGGVISSHWDDVYTYLSAMHQGARGNWAYQVLHTPEEHSGGPKNLFYLALGKLAGLLHLHMVMAYQLTRIVTGAFLLFSIYVFAKYFMEGSRNCLTAFILGSLGGGLGWSIPFLRAVRLQWGGWPSIPLELWLVEGFTLPTIMVFPHGELATAIMLITFLTVLEYQRTSAKKELIKIIAFSVALGVIQPICLPVLALTLCIHAAFIASSRKKRASWPLRREELVSTLSVGAISFILAAYIFYHFNSDSILHNWMAQNLTSSPPLSHYLWGYGFTVPFAILGAVRIWREKHEQKYLLIAWLVAVVALLYFPYLPQRRFSQGSIIPVGCLATQGMEWFFARLKKCPRVTLIQRLVLYLMVLSSVTVVAVHTSISLRRAPPLFHDRAELEIVSWLESNATPWETVLAGEETSAFIPAAIGHRVFWGHWCETINVQEKRSEFRRFFNRETTEEWRYAFLQRYGIKYLIYGPQERAWGEFDPSLASYLAKCFQTGGYAIYRIRTD